MSILIRLKNKLQDPSLFETKMREFDEYMSMLKNENVELHKRIDQLETLCKKSNDIQQTHILEEHIRQLEQENGRLFNENRCQRQEYQGFLDQLTKMVVRTAVMQKNIRKECASIYHVIERLTSNTIEINHPFEVLIKAGEKNLNKSCEITTNYQELPKIIDELLRSSSTSSSTTHCSISTSNSWTLDLSFDNKEKKTQLLISNKPIEQQVLQRSETFTISKLSSENPSSPLPITQPMIPTSTPPRPSRLPFRCSNLTSQLSDTQKVSKLPVRTASLSKKSNIPKPIVTKTKKDTTIISNRSNTPFVQPSIRSRSTTLTDNTHLSSPSSKCTKTTIEINAPIEQMNSTSSESSIEEEQQHINKLLPIMQDEGYSTWSSVDVKDDVIIDSITKNEINNRQKNIGLVKTWLDTSNRQYLEKPVKEVENDKFEEFNQHISDNSSFLCPFVRNRYLNEKSIPLPTTTISSLYKDISLDSLDSSQSEEQTITSPSSSSSSSSTFSRFELFEKVLLTPPIPTLKDNLTDSTSSTSSTFNMSEYIEDHFQDLSSENSSSFETTITDKDISSKPQKRLLFPGSLNRLIFIRRISSDSDLQRKDFSMNEIENQFHVYHSNIINEHSVEVNLMNTYGSDTELHVWSHDCAEQRRFLNERQQQQEQLSNQIEENNSYEQLALERQILLQQIYEYPWLLQENDLDRTKNIEQSLTSPSTDLIVPSHNSDFYQLCSLTTSSSFVVSYDPNSKDTTPLITSTHL